MNKKILISLIILAFSAVYAGVILTSFDVKSQNGNVIISWQTSSESNVNYFAVERKSVKGNFVELAQIQPQADHTYEYVDQSAYKTTDAVYVYHIKIVDNDGGVSYSDERAVVHNVSSVKRTWGSIKALFR
jgi:hypothetical protein